VGVRLAIGEERGQEVQDGIIPTGNSGRMTGRPAVKAGDPAKERMQAMWSDRRVIVAGGTAGFGLVLGRHLARHGAHVLLVGRSADGVRRALEVCERDGPVAHAVCGLTADLDQPGEGNRVAGEALRLLGGIDDLFYCVGRSGRAAILRTDRAELQAYLDANLLAAVEITRAVAEDVANSRGHVVYLGSLAGKLVTSFMGPYAVAKSALAAYADAVRLELSPRGAHVLLVSSGPIARASDDPAADRDSGRYAADVAAGDLPTEAIAPGGTRAITPLDPNQLAPRVLAACRRRQAELTVPSRGGILAGLIEWCPDFGRWLLSRLTRR
jgi:short-subunit dehydrogenase